MSTVVYSNNGGVEWLGRVINTIRRIERTRRGYRDSGGKHQSAEVYNTVVVNGALLETAGVSTSEGPNHDLNRYTYVLVAQECAALAHLATASAGRERERWRHAYDRALAPASLVVSKPLHLCCISSSSHLVILETIAILIIFLFCPRLDIRDLNFIAFLFH